MLLPRLLATWWAVLLLETAVHGTIMVVPLRRVETAAGVDPTFLLPTASAGRGRSASPGKGFLPATGLGRLNRRAVIPEYLVGNMSNIAFGYLGTLSIGTPPQSIPNIMLDTGSTYLWVMSSACPSCPGVKFNTSASTSFSSTDQSPVTSAYLDGTSVTGFRARDTVAIGGMAASPVEFLAVTSAQGFTDSINGIMGLAFTSADMPKTYYNHLAEAGLVDSKVFSYFIDDTDAAGAMVFGGVDRPRITGPVQWAPVAQSADGSYRAWTSRLESVSGCTSFALDGRGHVIFDTGTSLSFLPQAAATRINELLGFPQPPESTGEFSVAYMPCPNSTLPPGLRSVTFELEDGVQLTLEPKEYVHFLSGPGVATQCISLFAGLDGLPESAYLFGNAFLKHFLTIFDSEGKRIGFAPVNRQPAPVGAAGGVQYTPMRPEDYGPAPPPAKLTCPVVDIVPPSSSSAAGHGAEPWLATWLRGGGAVLAVSATTLLWILS